MANCVIGIKGSLVDCRAKACSTRASAVQGLEKSDDASILDPGLIPVFLLTLLLPLHWVISWQLCGKETFTLAEMGWITGYNSTAGIQGLGLEAGLEQVRYWVAWNLELLPEHHVLCSVTEGPKMVELWVGELWVGAWSGIGLRNECFVSLAVSRLGRGFGGKRLIITAFLWWDSDLGQCWLQSYLLG